MPVTSSLPTRRTVTRAAVATAAVSAALATLAVAGHDPAPATAARPALAAAVTPWEAQRPQTVPAAVVEEQHRFAVEAARPRTVRPVAGSLTSLFGTRWGALHAGLDFGDPIGAPIAAVTDGTVLEAGPAAGFGLWVRVQQDDGTVGVYGHVQDILAAVGQQVRAGDVIATVGNRGFSTGPHLHYEVHAGDGAKLDPLPWLAARGVDAHRPAG
ncbi:M23 family metallopeptidase [Nocardia sp. NPDC057227]|uniref:M23 family metallopeptidase n=1 Tax=Nocardia sp. NPDC057227 TaxID=3346056 RepID=UPI003625CC03